MFPKQLNAELTLNHFMINHLQDLLLMSDRISVGKKKGGGGGWKGINEDSFSAQLSSLYSRPWVKSGCIFKYIPAITVNNMVFYGMTPCGLVDICQGVAETYRLHFHSFSWVVLFWPQMTCLQCFVPAL
jgi:hypothetical protein